MKDVEEAELEKSVMQTGCHTAQDLERYEVTIGSHSASKYAEHLEGRIFGLSKVTAGNTVRRQDGRVKWNGKRLVIQ